MDVEFVFTLGGRVKMDEWMKRDLEKFPSLQVILGGSFCFNY
jgi:hypothetical protein